MSTSSVSFYATELENVTALVIDRAVFLDTVTDAVLAEHTDDAARRMVSFFGIETFPYTALTALLLDKDYDIRSKAYLALGNLVASDNPAVAKAAFLAACRACPTIASGFDICLTAKGAAYLLGNLVMRICEWSPAFDEMKGPVSEILIAQFKKGDDLMPLAMRDLLFAAKKLGAKNVSTNALLRVISGRTKGYKYALNLLADQVSQDDFPAKYHIDTFLTLRNLIIDDGVKLSTLERRELYWAFANIVTEPDIYSHFLTDTWPSAVDCVCDATADEDLGVAKEAVWCLVNAIELADLKMVESGDLDQINATLKTAAHSFAYSMINPINAATAKIDAENLRRNPPPAPTLVEDDNETYNYAEDCAMEIDDDATLPVEPNDDEWKNFINATTLKVEVPAAGGEGPYFPPTALDLLMGAKSFDGTSRVVCDLIRSVEANGNQYTPVPDDVVLTIADLQALESRGFSIVRRHIGINALLATAFY